MGSQEPDPGSQPGSAVFVRWKLCFSPLGRGLLLSLAGPSDRIPARPGLLLSSGGSICLGSPSSDRGDLNPPALLLHTKRWLKPLFWVMILTVIPRNYPCLSSTPNIKPRQKGGFWNLRTWTPSQLLLDFSAPTKGKLGLGWATTMAFFVRRREGCKSSLERIRRGLPWWRSG